MTPSLRPRSRLFHVSPSGDVVEDVAGLHPDVPLYEAPDGLLCDGLALGRELLALDLPSWLLPHVRRGVVPGRSSRRGEIEGLSAASARRFRHALLSRQGSGPRWAVTMTIHAPCDDAEWRRRVDAFSKRVARSAAMGSGYWRVELQRRRVPHLHCVAWSASPDLWRSAWLAVCGEDRDRWACRYADDVQPCTGARWYAYIAAHATKHKADQLGWRGRQWGAFGRSRLRPIPMVRSLLPWNVYAYAVRLYGVLMRFSGRRRYFGPYCKMLVFADAAEREVFRRCVFRALLRCGYEC